MCCCFSLLITSTFDRARLCPRNNWKFTFREVIFQLRLGPRGHDTHDDFCVRNKHTKNDHAKFSSESNNDRESERNRRSTRTKYKMRRRAADIMKNKNPRERDTNFKFGSVRWESAHPKYIKSSRSRSRLDVTFLKRQWKGGGLGSCGLLKDHVLRGTVLRIKRTHLLSFFASNHVKKNAALRVRKVNLRPPCVESLN
jgi:hypothetical protein